MTEAAGAAVDVTWTIGYTTICETDPLERAGYYEIHGEMNIPIASPGNLTNSFFGRCTGTPQGLLGTGYTPFYCSGKATGELEPLSVASRYRAAIGDVLRLQLSNLTEAPVSVQGSLTARWLSGGDDVFPEPVEMTLTLHTPTVT